MPSPSGICTSAQARRSLNRAPLLCMIVCACARHACVLTWHACASESMCCIPSNGAPSTLAHMNFGDCAGVCHACEPAAWLHRALGEPCAAVYAHSPSHSLAILLQPDGKYLLQTNPISALSSARSSIHPAQPCPAPVALTCPSSAIQGGGNARAGSSVSAMCKMV